MTVWGAGSDSDYDIASSSSASRMRTYSPPSYTLTRAIATHWMPKAQDLCDESRKFVHIQRKKCVLASIVFITFILSSHIARHISVDTLLSASNP